MTGWIKMSWVLDGTVTACHSRRCHVADCSIVEHQPQRKLGLQQLSTATGGHRAGQPYVNLLAVDWEHYYNTNQNFINDYCNVWITVRQRHFSRYPVVPTQVVPATDEVFIVQVRRHHSAPSSATEAESSRTDSIQTRRSGFQMLQWNGTDVPGRWTLPAFWPRD